MIKRLFSAINTLLLCFALVFPYVIWSQLPHTLWLHPLTAEEGLSQNYNWYVYHDSKGFVWISSISGLNRFDGVNMKQYYAVKGDTSSLMSEHIYSGFFEDNKQNIWFSTPEAIHCYLRQQDKFRRFFLLDDKGKKITGDYQVYFLEKDTFLWVGNGSSIYRFEIHRPHHAARKVLDTEYFHCKMEADARGGVTRVFAYGMADGLDIFPISNGEVINEHRLPTFFSDVRVIDVLPEGDSRAWLVTDKHGLISLNPTAKNHWRILGKFASNPFALASWDNKYLIVVARGKEIFLVNKEGNESVHPISCNFTNGDERPLQSVKNAYLDKEENLWLSDENQGLHYANLRKTKFRYIPKLQSVTGGNNYFYWAIEEDKSGNIWVGTRPGGIFLFDKQSRLVRQFAHQPGLTNSLPSNAVRDILSDKDDNIWVATSKGLAHFEIRHNRFRLVPTEKGRDAYLFAHLSQTGSGKLLAIAESSDLFEVKEKKGKKRLISLLPSATGNYQIIFEDKNNNLYCVRNSTEICVFNFENGRLVLKDSFPVDGLVYGFYEDEMNGMLYFATSNGLVKINKNRLHDEPVVYTVENGLPGNFIGEMLGIPGQKLWLGTNKGLVFFDDAKGSVRTFSLADGALSSEFHITAALKRSNGELWFGGSNGITIVPAGGHFEVVKNPPKVLITKIKVNNVERDSFDETGRTNVSQIERLVFRHDENTLTFEFVAIEYSDPGNNKLMYRLYANGDSSNAVWVQCPDAKGYAHFSYLPHDEYVLEIVGFSSDGVKSLEPRRLYIKIKPPFYQTYEFYALCVLIALFTGYFIFRAIVKRQLREKNLQLREQRLQIEKQEALSQERNRIAGEMHDDLGGGLTSIRMLSNRVQKKITNPDIQKQVDKIAQYSQELVQKMGEIIWAMNSNFDTIENLIAYIRRYAVDFLEVNGLRYHINEPEEMPDSAISGERRRNVYLAVKESLHNVVKHAGAGRVTISFEIKDGQQLSVRVQDDGKGIDLEQVNRFGNGLFNMRQRLRDVGGEMLIENYEGTLLTFIVPLEKLS